MALKAIVPGLEVETMTYQRIGARNLRRLPVLDLNGRTIGLVTLSDLSRRMLLDSGMVQKAVAELSGTQPS